MLVVSGSHWAIIRRHFTSHWLVFANRSFPILILFTSVDNDCSCSSGPEGKQRCKIGQLVLHLELRWLETVFRHTYTESARKATFPLRSPTKFTPVHNMFKVWSNGCFKATTIDMLIHGEIPLHSFLCRSRKIFHRLKKLSFWARPRCWVNLITLNSAV